MRQPNHPSPRALLWALAAGLFLGACNREFSSDNPFDPNSPNYAGEAWSRDDNRNGISDSVEIYAPDCKAGPDSCLAQARNTQAILASKGTLNGNGTGDTGTGEGPEPDSVRAENLQLTAGGEAAAPQVTWYPAGFQDKRFSLISDNAPVARVENGRILPVAAGIAQMTLITESGRLMETFTVTVTAKPKPPDPVDNRVHVISVSAKPMTLLVGEEAEAVLAWNPPNSTDMGYILSSQDPDKADIRGGKVAAKAPGAANILVTARDGGKTATFTVTIVEKDTRIRVISLSAPDRTVSMGEEGAPEITWNPADATDKSYKLMSADPAVVSVAGGRYKGESPGVATLMIQANDDPAKAATFKVKVVVPLVSATAQDMAMTAGDPARPPTVAFLPAQATDRRYRLASDDPEVAAIDQDTLVRPVGPGTAQVTLTTADGGKTSAFKVTVGSRVIPVQSILVRDMTLALGGPDAAPEITWVPADPTDKGYALAASASEEPVATVVDNKVHAVRGGSQEFTVTPSGGGAPATFRVTVTVPVEVTSITVRDVFMQEGDRDVRPVITLSPEDATDKSYRLVSADPSIAAVNASGSLDGMKLGQADVTVITRSGNLSATLKASVMQKKCVDLVASNPLDSLADIVCCKTTGKMCTGNPNAAVDSSGSGDDDGGDD